MKRLQFSLRSLFVLVAISAMAFLWYRDHVRIDRLEAQLAGKVPAEIRAQRWRVKQRELELATTKNVLLPQLEVYRINGFGDHQARPINADSLLQGDVETLLHNDFTDFQSVPIGLRQAVLAVYYAEHRLKREKMVLNRFEQRLKRAKAEQAFASIGRYGAHGPSIRGVSIGCEDHSRRVTRKSCIVASPSPRGRFFAVEP